MTHPQQTPSSVPTRAHSARNGEGDASPAGTGKPSEPAPMLGLGHPFASLRQEIDRLFDNFDLFDWRPDRGRRSALPLVPDWAALPGRIPAIDILERPDGYEVQAEVPGYTPDQIQIHLRDGLLTLRGQTSTSHEEKGADYHLSERGHGSFQRSLRLPRGIDGDKIEAHMARGILTLRLPKSAEARQHERQIRITAE